MLAQVPPFEAQLDVSSIRGEAELSVECIYVEKAFGFARDAITKVMFYVSALTTEIFYF